jgi:hypothetical protein
LLLLLAAFAWIALDLVRAERERRAVGSRANTVTALLGAAEFPQALDQVTRASLRWTRLQGRAAEAWLGFFRPFSPGLDAVEGAVHAGLGYYYANTHRSHLAVRHYARALCRVPLNAAWAQELSMECNQVQHAQLGWLAARLAAYGPDHSPMIPHMIRYYRKSYEGPGPELPEPPTEAGTAP